MNITEPSACLTRWRICLAGFCFDIKYKKGKENKLAYAIYGFQNTGETFSDNEDIPSLHTTQPTRTTVPDLENKKRNDEDTNEPTNFIEKEFDEDDKLLLTKEIHAFA